MKKKLIAMMCFVFLTTAISVFVMLDSSKTKTNTPTTNNKVVDNSKTPTSQNNNAASPNATKTPDSKNSDSAKPSEAAQSDATNNENYTLYEVKKGETLSIICKSYESICPTPVLSKAILKANNLSSANDIKETMKIKIPDKYINGSCYTVKAGDTLSTIATSIYGKSNVSKAIDTIKSDNYLTNESLKVGDKLFISNSKDSATETSANKNTEPQKSQTANANQATNTNSVPDTPKSNEELVSYTVKNGDTLSTIAKKYEKYCPLTVSTKVILKANGFTDSSSVKTGTELKLPEKYLTNGEKYTVKSGDTLSTIAKEHLSSMTLNSAVEKIKNDNFINSTGIKSGQQLYLTNLTLNPTN